MTCYNLLLCKVPYSATTYFCAKYLNQPTFVQSTLLRYTKIELSRLLVCNAQSGQMPCSACDDVTLKCSICASFRCKNCTLEGTTLCLSCFAIKTIQCQSTGHADVARAFPTFMRNAFRALYGDNAITPTLDAVFRSAAQLAEKSPLTTFIPPTRVTAPAQSPSVFARNVAMQTTYTPTSFKSMESVSSKPITPTLPVIPKASANTIHERVPSTGNPPRVNNKRPAGDVSDDDTDSDSEHIEKSNTPTLPALPAPDNLDVDAAMTIRAIERHSRAPPAGFIKKSVPQDKAGVVKECFIHIATGVGYMREFPL